MKGLRLAPDLVLPLDAVTRTHGILAVRGAGKSNTAAVMAEEMFGAGLPFVVVDPVGAWWGLRSSQDGTATGLPIPIFGGKHGDMPLDRGAGELLADLVVSKRLSCVLDLSAFESENDKKYFLLAFARRLYLKNEDPLHLFLEEADDYIPQRPMHDEAQLLRAWENIVRRGRARGLGMTLITQRSASLNKNVLTQVETLIVLRTTGPQDRAAIEAWIQYHQQSRDVLASLAGLEDGEAWVWSPHVLKTMRRVRVRRRRTFDSGATPANVRGKDARPVATLADVDLSALQKEMSATIERAKADDPRELRKRIAEKDRELKLLQAEHARSLQRIPENIPPQRVEVPVLTDQQVVALEKLVHLGAATAQQLTAAVDEIAAGLRKLVHPPGRLAPPAARRLEMPTPQRRAEPRREGQPVRVDRTASRRGEVAPPDGLTIPEQRILNALGWWEAAGIARPTRHQVAFVARYSVNGHFNNALGAMRTNGLLDYPAGGCVALTAAGRAAAESPVSAPTRDELIQRVQAVLRQEPQRRIFMALVEADAVVSREDLASRCRYSVNGHFNNMLGSLRSLGVVDYPQGGHVGLSPLFEAVS